MSQPLLSTNVMKALRDSFERTYTAEAVTESLGLAGEAALSRSDFTGVERLARTNDPTHVWIRLFVLGLDVPERAVQAAVGADVLETAIADRLLARSGADVRALLDIRPYGEVDGPNWWVLSDFGSDVRPGRLDPEHVLGPGRAATTLAEATVRTPVARALDIGTGCGIQALHLSRHADSVTATDLSSRALRMAATTAAFNDLDWALLEGSLLEPVEGQRFDLVVCNPPFIVGPGFEVGADGFRYRDSGLRGDEVSRRLVSGIPDLLDDGGTGQLLANWMITADEPWQERVAGWLGADDCSMWVWQREVAEPGEYVSLWLRDGGEQPGTDTWRRRYDAWMDWFAATGVLAVGMGLVSIQRTAERRGTVVLEDVPQAVETPCGPHIRAWFERADWLDRRGGSDGIFAAPLAAADDLVLTNSSVLSDEGWNVALSQLRQTHGLRWEIEADAVIAGLVAASRGTVPLGALADVLAASLGEPVAAVREALAPVAVDLVRRGFLLPPELV